MTKKNYQPNLIELYTKEKRGKQKQLKKKKKTEEIQINS